MVVKIIVGVNLLSYATRRHAGMDARAAADTVNDFGRDPIGEGKEEKVSRMNHRLCLGNHKFLKKYNRELKAHLDNSLDDVLRTAEIGENPPGKPSGSGRKDKKERVKLEDLTRYTMVKRIW